MPQANNMDTKHCAGQTKILDYQLKRYLEGLFDEFSCQNKDPGFNFRQNYTLSGNGKVAMFGLFNLSIKSLKP